MSNCLTDIIGVVNEACECDGDLPSELNLNVSKSGYYIGNEGSFSQLFQQVKKGNDCTSNDVAIWEDLAATKEEAIKEVYADIGVELRKREVTGFNIIDNQLSGLIGDKLESSKGILSSDYAVVRIDFNRKGNNYFKLKKIGLGTFHTALHYSPIEVEKFVYLFDLAGNPISFKDSEGNTQLYATITTKQNDNSWYEFTEPLVDKYGFYIAYEDEGHYYNSNRVWCGCNNNRPKYLDFIDFNGFVVSDINDLGFLNDTVNTNKEKPLFNLKFDIETYCDFSMIACQNMTEDIYNTIARMCLHLACSKVAHKMIHSDKIDYERLLDWDWQKMNGVRAYHNNQYHDLLQHLAPRLNVTSSGCHDCKSKGYSHKVMAKR